jgi:hypothetical protein
MSRYVTDKLLSVIVVGLIMRLQLSVVFHSISEGLELNWNVDIDWGSTCDGSALYTKYE